MKLPVYPQCPKPISKEVYGNQRLEQLTRFASNQLRSTFEALDYTDQLSTLMMSQEYTIRDIQLQDAEGWAGAVRQDLANTISCGLRNLEAMKSDIHSKEELLAEECNKLEAQMMRVRESADSIAHDKMELNLLTAEHGQLSKKADNRKRHAQQTVDNIRRQTLKCGQPLPENLRQLVRDGICMDFKEVGGKRARFWKDVHALVQGPEPQTPSTAAGGLPASG